MIGAALDTWMLKPGWLILAGCSPRGATPTAMWPRLHGNWLRLLRELWSAYPTL